MKRLFLATSTFFTLIFSLFPLFGQIPEHVDEDNTLAPFFFVQSEDASIDQLPLKETFASVDISGIIADVKVTQVYKNEGLTKLEAIYIFPASTRAAVYAMKMTIGERIIQARIEKRETARAEYTQALAEGRTASLLEQQRPNVFQMNVGNILPGDEIKIELFYTELLLSENQMYEFVFPTVVGPRYSNQKESDATTHDLWVKNPYLHSGRVPTYVFDIDITLSAGLPIKEILSPSHEVDVNYLGKDRALINLTPTTKNSGNRDFIVKYRLAGDMISPGLLLYEGEKENFFLMMLQPPKRVRLEEIPGREYIFIVDVSGSMNGFPLDISKKLLRDLIGNLRSSDLFNVLLFAAGSNVLAEHSLPATEGNINKAIRLIESKRGGGGTELLPALKKALALPKQENYSRTIVIATDGYVNVEKQAFDLIRNNLGKANMFAFGIGSSVNRFLIEGIARAGMGESFVITRAAEAAAKADKFREYISTPVLTNITYAFEGVETYDVEPVAIPDVLAERPVLIFGKWRGRPEGTITLNGKSGGGKSFSKQINLSDYKPSGKNAGLRYLWARYKIAMLNDYNQVSSDIALVEKITDLGLTYSLLTGYTSFVATDTEIRSGNGESVTVKQPLPLPQGVSNMALAGGSAGRGYGGTGWNKMRHYSGAPVTTQMDVMAEEAGKEVPLKDDVLLIRVHSSQSALENELRELAKSYNNDFKDCYRNSIQYGKSGKLVIDLILDSTGNIKEIKIVDNELKDKSLEKCFKTIIKNWQFASISIKDGTKLSFEFRLGN